jgi:hypothetical protein
VKQRRFSWILGNRHFVLAGRAADDRQCRRMREDQITHALSHDHKAAVARIELEDMSRAGSQQDV